MKEKLIEIAKYLTTREGGGKSHHYLIYKDDKIKIRYDTYCQNVRVDAFVFGKWTLAARYGGRGDTEKFHYGYWCDYVKKNLYPRAVDAGAETK